MDITINNFRERLSQLLSKGISLYASGDLIVFELNDKTIVYRSQETFISNVTNPCNEEIFNELDVDKVKFCRRAYCHEPSEGDCPECRKNCLSSINNLVYNIFCEIETKNLCTPIKTIPLEEIKLDLIPDESGTSAEIELPW